MTRVIDGQFQRGILRDETRTCTDLKEVERADDGRELGEPPRAQQGGRQLRQRPQRAPHARRRARACAGPRAVVAKQPPQREAGGQAAREVVGELRGKEAAQQRRGGGGVTRLGDLPKLTMIELRVSGGKGREGEGRG